MINNYLVQSATGRKRALMGPKQGFSLIELIGVLAVIAILASLLIPKIFESIYNGQINQTLVSIQTIKTAVTDHYGKFTSLASLNGSPLTVSGAYTNYDGVLLQEGLLDKPFASKLGTNSIVQLVSISSLSTSSSPDGSNGAYDLNGNGKNDVVGSYLVEAVINGVDPTAAKELNNRLDGPGLGDNGNSGNDFLGRVIYHKPIGQGTTVSVHVYIVHY